ncbi:phage integrase SAM-like domain-containing protein [Chryseobacterium sp. Mn2064]|uniref:phage integrase SAM-like domain-containing protein n=1 Tax=Chryseobacterium sp. Mn2064 TaxID=3395263 RepID=UPI003BDC1376
MAVAYFKKFVGNVFLFKHLNETLCEAYKNYLLSSPALRRSRRKIQKNTATTYFSRFKSALKKPIGTNTFRQISEIPFIISK